MALTKEIKQLSIKRYKEERDWFKLNFLKAERVGFMRHFGGKNVIKHQAIP